MRVTVAQLTVSLDHGSNLLVARDACLRAKQASSDLLVLPEYANGYDPSGVGADHAEPLDGPFVAMLREQTRESDLTVIAGFVLDEARAGGYALGLGGGPLLPVAGSAQPTVSNVVVAVRAGEIAGVYRKVHLYDAFGSRESDRLLPGDPGQDPLVVSVAGLRVGVMTCYDLRFPESARRLVDAGTEVIVVPAAWAAGPGKVDQWRVLAQARAIENVCAVIAVGQAGRGVSGHSLVIGPDGAIGIELGDAAAFSTADIDADGVLAERERNPSLSNRRYGVVPR